MGVLKLENLFKNTLKLLIIIIIVMIITVIIMRVIITYLLHAPSDCRRWYFKHRCFWLLQDDDRALQQANMRRNHSAVGLLFRNVPEHKHFSSALWFSNQFYDMLWHSLKEWSARREACTYREQNNIETKDNHSCPKRNSNTRSSVRQFKTCSLDPLDPPTFSRQELKLEKHALYWVLNYFIMD